MQNVSLHHVRAVKSQVALGVKQETGWRSLRCYAASLGLERILKPSDEVTLPKALVPLLHPLIQYSTQALVLASEGRDSHTSVRKSGPFYTGM